MISSMLERQLKLVWRAWIQNNPEVQQLCIRDGKMAAATDSPLKFPWFSYAYNLGKIYVIVI